MEEEKAAAYYEELSRKGGGAARFKQGLGFNNSNEADSASRGIASSSSSSSSSSFMSKFVRASASSGIIEKEKEEEEKERKTLTLTQIQNIQNKLKKPSSKSSSSNSRGDRVEHSSSRESKRRSDDDRHRHRHRRSDDERDSSRTRDRSRSVSPRDRRRFHKGREAASAAANLIPAYHNLTPAERVKAKMKLQLSQAAANDTKIGIGLQWERFDFNKDAPLDDAEIEAADDDAALVKQIGKSFRFSSLEDKKDDEIKNAHDEAMFGVPAPNLSYASESEDERRIEKKNKEANDGDPANNLINEKVLQKQQGTWRDRARRNVG